MAGTNKRIRKVNREKKYGTGLEWTIKELAQALGTAVSTLKNIGYPVKYKRGVSNIYDSVECIDLYIKQQIKTIEKEEEDDKQDYNRLHKKNLAEHIETKTLILKGQHVPISVVEELNSEIVSTAKAQFENIPVSMASLLSNKDPRYIKKKLVGAIHGVLDEMERSFAASQYSSNEYIELLEASEQSQD